MIYCRRRKHLRGTRDLGDADLFHFGTSILVKLLERSFTEHFLLWVHRHGHVQESLVQEGDAGFEAPRHGRLVCTQAVGRMQVLNAFHRLLMECGSGGCSMEIKVSWKKDKSIPGD